MGTFRMPRPSFDKTTGWWHFIWTGTQGRRQKRALAKDPRWTGPGCLLKTPPADVVLLAQKYEQIALQAKHGVDLSPARPARLAPFVESYRSAFAVSGKARNSIVQLGIAARSFLEFCAIEGIASVQAVTPSVCRNYLEAGARAGKKRRTLQQHKGLLSPIFRRARMDGLIDLNPWEKLPVPGEAGMIEAPFWTDEEVAKIESCLRGWARDLFVVGVNSGFRIAGLVNLKWGDVLWHDPKRPGGSLVCRVAKGGKPYTIPLFPRLREVLERRKREEMRTKAADYVFPSPVNPDRPMLPSSVNHRIGRAVKKAGLPAQGRYCHAMRDTFGTHCAARGIHPRTLMAWMNHSSIKQTNKYCHWDRTSEASEVSKLS